MANSIIEQQPLYNVFPVGQETIFVVSNAPAVANQYKVKFVAEVHISSTTPPNVSSVNDIVGTFKTTPNNLGIGIFDFSSIIENYVKADNMAADGSAFLGTTTTVDERHPIHLIDKYSLNTNAIRYMAIQFKVEYLGATDSAGNQDDNVVRIQFGTAENSAIYTIFNGYLKYTDILNLGTGVTAADFGYDLDVFKPETVLKRFLTNAPTTQYANIDDYGTMAFLSTDSTSANKVVRINFEYYSSAGASLGNDSITKTNSTGAYPYWNSLASRQLVYVGCYPANLRRDGSTTFASLVTAGTIQGGYYTITAYDSASNPMLESCTVNLNCPNLKGYESIRLCWLNQWGVWDYYTFTQKSVQSISTKGTTYTQLAGTWNESRYRIDSYKGGKKSFRVNSTEKITMNTDFVTEATTIMFEELINSPEVYLLDSYQTTSGNQALNQFVTPVRITTSSFTKKTIANDKLMQYTFEIEKSKTLRTQSV
jgi:hypothetical protein